MKPRKAILTIEMLTNLSGRAFTKDDLQDVLDYTFVDPDLDEVLEVQRIRFQVVKEDK